MNTTNYVAGFLFRGENSEEVALIKKSKPDWQKGKLNGIGGKIEVVESGVFSKDPISCRYNLYELPIKTMIREFVEEAGVCIADWKEFCQLNHRGGTIYFFESHVDYDVSIVSMTDEEINWYNVNDILQNKYLIIPNLLWLIPMALDKNKVLAIVQDNS